MPGALFSLITLKNSSPSEIESFFQSAEKLQQQPGALTGSGRSIALLFFEPSTRTRLSFESAAHRIGCGALVMDVAQGTSLEKGETLEDTILNVAAMKPAALVIRAGDDLDMSLLAQKLSMPIFNAGWGMRGHPTQALLDFLTLRKQWGDLAGKKLLIVGDVKHSRVAASHFELATKLGVEIGLCGPKEFLPQSWLGKSFVRLSEGLQWSDAVMALRFQFERHDKDLVLGREQFRAEYGLNSQSLKDLGEKGWILHPGPVNHGVEIETEVFSDARCLIFEQVEQGVYMREALLRRGLGEQL